MNTKELTNEKNMNVANNNATIMVESAEVLEDLFDCEVIDTAYTCHENRNGVR